MPAASRRPFGQNYAFVVAGAYVMNKQGNALIGDPRAVRLIQAAYASL